MKLLFIRHGNPNYEKDCLTPIGKVQAELLAERFKYTPLDQIYCSTMGRARETASYTLEKLGRKADAYFDWMRELDWGKSYEADYPCPWDLPREYLLGEEVYNEQRSWYQNPHLDGTLALKVCEERFKSLDAFLEEKGYRRVDRHYERIECVSNEQGDSMGHLLGRENGQKDIGDDRVIAFFCHAAFSSVMVGHLVNLDPFVMLKSFSLPHTSVTCVDFSTEISQKVYPRVVYWGDTSHLFKRPDLFT